MKMIKIRLYFVQLKLILLVKSNSSLVVFNHMQVYDLNIRLIFFDDFYRPLNQLPGYPISSKFIDNPNRHYVGSFLSVTWKHWFSWNFVYDRLVCFISNHDCSNNNLIIKCSKAEPTPALDYLHIEFIFISYRKPFFMQKLYFIHVFFCKGFEDKERRVELDLRDPQIV